MQPQMHSLQLIFINNELIYINRINNIESINQCKSTIYQNLFLFNISNGSNVFYIMLNIHFFSFCVTKCSVIPLFWSSLQRSKAYWDNSSEVLEVLVEDFLDVDRIYDMLAMNAINQKLEKAQSFVLVSINPK